MIHNVDILEDEDVENIIWGGFSLIQKKKGFRFGLDAYLLADFISPKAGDKIIDLGTGTGIISFLLAAKGRNVKITALDILPQMTYMVERSVKMNNISNIHVVTGDLREATAIFGRENFTLVVSNPPYFPVKSGEYSANEMRAVARTEIACSLGDLIKSAAKLLTYNGRFAFIHRPSRLPEIFSMLKEYSFEPKRMRFIYPFRDKEPNGVLIEARKNAGHELRILPPLFIYDSYNEYSKELQGFFEKDRRD